MPDDILKTFALYPADVTVCNTSYQPHMINPCGVPSKAALSIYSMYCPARVRLQTAYKGTYFYHITFSDGYEFVMGQTTGLFLTGAVLSPGSDPSPTTKPRSTDQEEGHQIGFLHLRSNIWLAVGESARAPGSFERLGLLDLHDRHDSAADMIWPDEGWVRAGPVAARGTHLSPIPQTRGRARVKVEPIMSSAYRTLGG